MSPLPPTPARRFERIDRDLALKASRAARPPSYGGTAGTYHAGTGGTARRWSARDLLSELTPIDHNPVVRVCLNWYAAAITQAFFRVGRRIKSGPHRGEYRADDSHRLGKILARPNPAMSYRETWSRCVADYKIDGNAYLAIGRDNAGEPTELWWVPPWQIEVRASGVATRPVASYRVSAADGGYVDIPPEEMVHIRDLPDPRNPIVGLGTMKCFLEYLAALSSGGRYTDRALRRGNTGIVLMPPKEAGGGFGYSVGSAEESEMLAHKRRLDLGMAREDGTATVALTSYLEHAVIGLSPEQMTLDRILDRPEAYLCAAMGLSPLLLDLPSSSATRTYANKGEARRGAWEDSAVPMLGVFSEAIADGVLYRRDPAAPPWDDPEPQFSGDGPGMEVWADTSEVPALQEDRAERAAYWIELATAKLCSREYAATQLDIPPEAIPEDEPAPPFGAEPGDEGPPPDEADGGGGEGGDDAPAAGDDGADDDDDEEGAGR